MIDIKEKDIEDGVGLLFNTPQLRSINTSNEFKEIITDFSKDIYLKETQELKDNFRNRPNQKLVQALFSNYGISPNYYQKLNPILKRKLVYYLETLFQQKGNLKNLEVISEIFKDFFKDINYYGISVNKFPYHLNGVVIPPGELSPDNEKNEKRKFLLGYFLKPILISNEKLKKFFPTFNVDQSGKYLMKLDQFSKHKTFPMDTNLMHIDFIDSSYLRYSDSYYLQLSTAYTMTKFQNSIINFSNNEFLDTLDSMYFKDINIILTYFNYRFIRFNQKCRKEVDAFNEVDNNEELFDFKSNRRLTSSLIFDESKLDIIELLALEYKKLEYRDKKIIKNLSRRWQFLLQSNYMERTHYSNFQELDEFMELKYPTFKTLMDTFENSPGNYSNVEIRNLDMEEIHDVSKLDYVNFLMNLYIQNLDSISDGNDFVELTINSYYQNILNSGIFIEFFFNPVFKLFANYFMPGNLDYTATSANGIIVADKFEAIFMDDEIGTEISTCNLDNRYLPCDRVFIKYPFEIKEIFNYRESLGLTINTKIRDKQKFDHLFKFDLSSELTDGFISNDINDIELNKTIADKRITTDKVIRVIKQANYFTEEETYIKKYMWKLERCTGITKKIDLDLEPDGHMGNDSINQIDDYLFMKKDCMFNIHNYLFYKNI